MTSPIFANPLPSSIPFPVTGIYSCNNLSGHPTAFPCAYKVTTTDINANAIFVSNSPVGAVTRLRYCGIKNLSTSFTTPNKFDNSITKNRVTTYLLTRGLASSPRTHSKKFHIPSNIIFHTCENAECDFFIPK